MHDVYTLILLVSVAIAALVGAYMVGLTHGESNADQYIRDFNAREKKRREAARAKQSPDESGPRRSIQ